MRRKRGEMSTHKKWRCQTSELTARKSETWNLHDLLWEIVRRLRVDEGVEGWKLKPEKQKRGAGETEFLGLDTWQGTNGNILRFQNILMDGKYAAFLRWRRNGLEQGSYITRKLPKLFVKVSSDGLKSSFKFNWVPRQARGGSGTRVTHGHVLKPSIGENLLLICRQSRKRYNDNEISLPQFTRF